MKRSLCFSLVLGVAVATGWLLTEVPASAQDGQGGVTVSGNGDVNGDNGLDLSDAIYLLSFLFQGGAAPFVCPPGAGGAGGGVPQDLPDAGQLLCYNIEAPQPGVEEQPIPLSSPLSCNDADCPGQDASYAIGCQIAGRFILDDGGTGDDGNFFTDPRGGLNDGSRTPFDDVVTDTCTGLMWQRGEADFTGDGLVDTFAFDVDEPDWCTALDYCENLVLTVGNGFKDPTNPKTPIDPMDPDDNTRFDDWRMPNIRELLSLVNFDTSPAWHTDIPPGSSDPLFYATSPTATWSSTSRLDLPDQAFFLSGAEGKTSFGNAGGKNVGAAIRAVRTVAPAGGGAGRAGGGRGQGGQVVSGNGDVNGDNGLDLSDAIYLLSFLFQGGPEPKPCPGTLPTETNCDDTQDNDLDGATDCDDSDCAGVGLCPLAEICDNGEDDDDDTFIDCADRDCAQAANCQVEGGTGLPDTGQTVCTASNGALVPCDSPTCFGVQDGSFDTGCGSLNRFVDNGDGTVTDTCTGLEWARDTADIDGGGVDPTPESGDRISWCAALAHCEGLTLGGDDDWRLPNVFELESIVHYGFTDEPPSVLPTIDPTVFTDTVPARYWTSTSRNNQQVLAWSVDFAGGTVQPDGGWKEEDEDRGGTSNDAQSLHYVRAVRGPGP